MKSRIFLLNLFLAAVLLASCAPKAAQPPAPVNAAPPQAAATQVPGNTSPAQATEVLVQAAPTSRGDKLEATDPATVNLASGDLQLVEFFRFT